MLTRHSLKPTYKHKRLRLDVNSPRENIDYSYGDFAIPCCRLKRILRVSYADFQSEKLVMLLLQVMMIKTNRKAKHYFNGRMKVDTSVRTLLETCNSLVSVIFDMSEFVSRDI